jgi:hypothetical protein
VIVVVKKCSVVIVIEVHSSVEHSISDVTCNLNSVHNTNTNCSSHSSTAVSQVVLQVV